MFEKKLGYQYDRNASLDHFDERMDCLATLLAAYPTANTYKLAKEFGLTRNYLMQLVAHYGVYKTEERRHEIRIENGREAFIRMLWAERRNRKNLNNHANQTKQKHFRRNDGDEHDAE